MYLAVRWVWIDSSDCSWCCRHPALSEKVVVRSVETPMSLTWMRHLLTSLAQRALLQPEVRDRPDRRKRTAAAAGRRIS